MQSGCVTQQIPATMRNVLFLLLLPLGLPAQGLFDSLYIRSTVNVFFQTGSADLDADARSRLDSFLARLPNEANWAFLNIEAHTDSIGNSTNNERLAASRAESVRRYLGEKGVAPARIRAKAYGERKPDAHNDTEAGRQRNRRAAVELWSGKPMATLSGYIRDAETGKGLETTVFFSTQTRSDSTQTDTAGFYSVRLPKDSIVRVDAVAEGYFFESYMTKVFGSPELYKKYKKDTNIALAPAKAGEKAVLRDLFYVGNKAVLLPVSEPELPKILRFMQVNPEIRVEIAGHINHPGLSPDNLENWEWELSVNRAKLVYTYLLDHGVSAKRMRFRGYGNAEMLFPNPVNEAQMEKNRRVEIRVY